MGLFSKLFGKAEKSSEHGGETGLTPEQFVLTSFVQDIIVKSRREATLLNPQTSTRPLNTSASKFGGAPNLNGFEIYPCCSSCNTPLNFVLQLYKSEFPTLYFPADKNLFQLFRCPNHKCPDAYSHSCHSDLKMFVYYFADQGAEVKPHFIPLPPPDMEVKVPDCFLKSTAVADYPIDEDFSYGGEMEAKFGEELTEYFTETYYAVQRTKIGGYPSFTQSSYYPNCSCGRVKEFFFQLSSNDIEEGVANPIPDKWSPHHIMIGDLGNIYFYVCKNCGEQSIESYWDCH